MKIENFLNDFEENKKRIEEAKIQKQYAEDEKQMANENYLADFQEYYENTVLPKLKTIEKKLDEKFEVDISTEPHSAQRAYFYKMELQPKFEHYVEKIEVQIIAEGERRLITLSGSAYGPHKKNLNDDGLHRFQDVREAFEKIDLESEITAMLNKIFLRK